MLVAAVFVGIQPSFKDTLRDLSAAASDGVRTAGHLIGAVGDKREEAPFTDAQIKDAVQATLGSASAPSSHQDKYLDCLTRQLAQPDGRQFCDRYYR